ncbi:D-inositol-3-phosphate glycosyltransferase [anaerobic digester metagenome]
MKILFPLAKAGSGSDIFTYNLVSGLNNSSIHADIQYLPNWSGYIPSFMGKMCKSAGYDIIHSNTWNGFAFVGLSPLVVTEHLIVHDPIFYPYKSIAQRLYHSKIFYDEQKTILNSDMVVSISRYCQKKIEEFFDYDNSVLIYNGIDEEIFKPINTDPSLLRKKYGLPTDKKILFFSGNPTIRKGGDLLPHIMKELGNEYILLMTGGLRKGQIRTGQNIISLGRLTLQELIEIYNLGELFLFPTRMEGFCLSILEAMSCGMPIVSTNVASLPEQVIDGKGGVLCPMDDIRAFANAVRYITEDESIHRKMGIFNRSRVLSEFSLTKMVKNYVNIYKKL